MHESLVHKRSSDEEMTDQIDNQQSDEEQSFEDVAFSQDAEPLFAFDMHNEDDQNIEF